jgi:hypothetical protein
MRENRIRLHLEGGSWVATFSGPRAAIVTELFGGKLPRLVTAFTSTMPAAEVLEEISRLNPDCDVSLLAAN